MAFTSFSGNSYQVISDDAKPADFHQIPIIDLSLPRMELVAAVKSACTRVGFFYVKNHGVPKDVIQNVFRTSKEFFTLEPAEKETVDYRNLESLRGYEGIEGVQTDKTRKPDLNEAFSWGYTEDIEPQNERPDTTSQRGVMDTENQWPPDLPELRQNVVVYFRAVLALARRLIRIFALALGLPENAFDAVFERPGAMGKILHYPPQKPTESTSDALGIGAHTDIECFTILCQDEDVPGLQVLNTRGEWILAPPIDGTFVVNIGDMLARWSNDVFLSTVHRVLNITGKERYSLPTFVGPSYDTVITPLETCRGHASKYESIRAGLYLWKRLAVSRLDKDDYERQLVEMEKRMGTPIPAET